MKKKVQNTGSKVVPVFKCYTMQACGGNVGTTPCILDLITRYKRGVNFMPQPVYFERGVPSLNRGLDGPQQFDTWQKRKVLFSVLGIDPNF
jgi:hypothetical protein